MPAHPVRTRGGSLDDLRRANRRTVLGHLVTEGPQSRAQLARASGLSASTVSSLVTELLEAGHVRETTVGRAHKGGSGRPPLLVELATPPGGVVGVDIGHGHVRVAAAGPTGDVLAESVRRVDVDAAGPATLDLAAAMIRSTLADAGLDPSQVHAAGMCVPAPIDRETSMVSTGILPGWRGINPAAELGRRIEAPVIVDNDANLGALAEVRHGAARGHHDVVYVKLASGVGSGLVLGGRVHRGATGMAGELGHVQIGEDGEVCRCGNRGCLETRVSARRLLHVLQPAHDEDLTIARVLELEATGDAGVRRVLSDAGATIGRALADLSNHLNPSMVVIGGPLGGAASVVEGVRRAVDRYAQPATAAALQVCPGRLGERAEVVGAVTMAVAMVTAGD
ncbi:ROK family transcriptional regulator [Nocardioides sp. zg-1308]|uniref:ROK family transcriptional regulator n=1 Tax=Nocardioides renjunii TaxID=3095075 RepID=A0ABU5KG26_9ACTN|nr:MULTISPECIES: ROK family transcriptional regulator [unclassified Nocardioides]MDZ5663916.1 ROK family transcriptional regulator [Nocardioides sp. S-58]NPD03112.1 ROK family transcriptional regulator [Nocardioides sp. zg-1308]WQQ21006.1 ROK family transcriptional regulator [Nocardioides sp. S-34]